MPSLGNSPGVDIVIPTLNCEQKLSRCLDSIQKQDFTGEKRILVIDGGSSDKTVKVASTHQCEVHIMPGMYSTGLGGARDYALSLQELPLTWQVDADNVIVEKTTLTNLVTPFLSIDGLVASVPLINADEHTPPLDRYFAYQELQKLRRCLAESKPQGGNYILEDLSYGITNCTVVKTDMIRRVGGYDSDMRVWARARSRKLSRSCVVTNAHYLHLTGDYLGGWTRKQLGRIKKLSQMRESALQGYLHEETRDPTPFRGVARDLVEMPLNGPRLISTDKRASIFSVAIPTVIIGIAVIHPILSFRLIRGYFGRPR